MGSDKPQDGLDVAAAGLDSRTASCTAVSFCLLEFSAGGACASPTAQLQEAGLAICAALGRLVRWPGGPCGQARGATAGS
jgi:hypothetical protein